MSDFLEFFENLPEWQALAWLLSCIFLSMLLEALLPLVRFDFNKLKHDAFNYGLFVMNLVIVSPLAIALGVLAIWAESNQVGLLYWIALPVWLELLIAILMLDLIAQYGVHYYLHHVRCMWRLHMVHHSDTHVDASTATRQHFGDTAFRLIASMLAIVVVGIPPVYYIVYRLITPFFGYLTHANVRLPVALDRAICYVFVTPDMHKFHHHYRAPWTDSNFGNIFSFWDRMFGTLVYEDRRDIRYGLDVMEDGRELDFVYQMLSPVDAGIDTSVRPGLS